MKRHPTAEFVNYLILQKSSSSSSMETKSSENDLIIHDKYSFVEQTK